MSIEIISNIYLIRHGLTEGNLKNWCYGGIDIPLADEGIQGIKVRVSQKAYPNYENADLYTSAMKRARQTFNLIYGEIESTPVEAFNEFHFGEFEGKTIEELKMLDSFLEWSRDKTGDRSAPGGESFNGFRKRVSSGWQKLVELHSEKELLNEREGSPVASVLVCHGGVISVIMDEVFPKANSKLFGWTPDPGHGYAISMRRGEPLSYEAF
ncbi:MAG: histidine phosphatase family protein [Eubacteriales bacterium]|nr:histidine phosphatase family protein [Eubacteriales bacterium]MDD4390476.1 histidine phosphatase family protein [Eubacteriales bacterium]